jgi:hypothetical protein
MVYSWCRSVFGWASPPEALDGGRQRRRTGPA